MADHHQRTRSTRLQVSSDSDSDDLPLTELMKKTPSKNEHSDDDVGSYSRFRPLMTSTPSVFDSGQIEVRRGSERLKRKRGREFRMPSRKDVFDEIAESSSKSYSHLQPRSLINNFTKENHRYNYDRASTSGESSIDDFIDDDEEEDDDDDPDCQHSERQPHFTRLKQTKVCRIGTSSSSSSEDDQEKKTQRRRTTDSETERSDGAKCKARKNKRRNSALETDSSATENSEAENVTPVGKRFRGSVLLVTSSDGEESQTGKVVLNESAAECLVDSGIGSTRFEDGKTNTTADFASIALDNDHVTGNDASCSDDMDPDTGSLHVSVGRDSGNVTGKYVASGIDGSSEEEGEGRRGTSERVRTLAGRKEHRRNVIMTYRQERLRRLK